MVQTSSGDPHDPAETDVDAFAELVLSRSSRAGRRPDRAERDRAGGGPVAPTSSEEAQPGSGRTSATWVDELDEADLRRLATTLPVIEQAKGLLMGYYGIGADEAFDVLRRWSSVRHITLRTLCGTLLAFAAAPQAEPFDGLEGLLSGGAEFDRPVSAPRSRPARDFGRPREADR